MTETTINKKASTLWTKSNVSYKNYQDYIAKKVNRHDLTFVDLLYISNFKGGNATINEQEQKIDIKLIAYSKRLDEIEKEFKNSILADITNEQIESLSDLILDSCNLTLKSNASKIDGFSVSYLSALLNAYFPTLIPIIDRRVLINLGIVTSKDINSQGQIKNIKLHYKLLIEKVSMLCKSYGETVREIDHRLFIQNHPGR